MKQLSRSTQWLLGSVALLAVLAVLGALVWQFNVLDEADVGVPPAAVAASPALLERGAYLARAGNCMGCHTARGGLPYAGGRAVETPNDHRHCGGRFRLAVCGAPIRAAAPLG